MILAEKQAAIEAAFGLSASGWRRSNSTGGICLAGGHYGRCSAPGCSEIRKPLSRFAAHQSDEIILLTVFGLVLLLAGLAQQVRVSAAIAAFLVGIAVSGSMAEQSHRLLAPLRDLFAATFFFFFGLDIDPATLLPALPFAVGLGLVTAIAKILTGFGAARQTGVDKRGRLRAGMALVARGEFSIVIAGLGAGIEPQLGPLAAAYVLFLAALGPLLARLTK